jgi:thymidylate synthase (FAD)
MSDRQIQVTFLNSMGSCKTVVNAARVSFRKQQVSDDVLGASDIKLINYLAKHKHMSPFGHCFASFHIKAPVFVARQLVKHQYLRLNEVSRRYIDDEPEFYAPDVWRGKAANKKQGSSGVVSTQTDVSFVNHTALTAYNDLLADGVAPEQARLVLPLSLMTEFWWSGSLDAFADMCRLRLAPDTQAETRLVAEGIDNCMKVLYTYSWNALLNREVT